MEIQKRRKMKWYPEYITKIKIKKKKKKTHVKVLENGINSWKLFVLKI